MQRVRSPQRQNLMKRGTMQSKSVRFDDENLAEQIERLSQHELDSLPFGVILLDREGTVMFYSQTEARRSGYGRYPIGENLFEISPCMAQKDFRGRIQSAMDAGPVDLEFGWAGDFADPNRDLRLRVVSSSNNGIWIFVDRDDLSDQPRKLS